MKPISNHDQALQSVQCLLTVLSDETRSTPNNLLEGVVSGKSILRGLIQGGLMLCSTRPEPEKKELLTPPPPPPPPPPPAGEGQAPIDDPIDED